MSTDHQVLSQDPAPAPQAEVVQPGNEAEGTGASDQGAEEQRRASEAGRVLAGRRNQENAFTRIQRRAEQLEQQNAQLTQAYLESQRTRQQQHEPTAAPQRGNGEPTRDQFDSWDDFVIAKAEYRAEAKTMARLQQVAAEAQRMQGAHAEQAVVRGHVSRVEQYAQKNPGFDAAIEAAGDMELPAATSYAIPRMEDGPAILEAIARNPELAHALHRMPPEAQLLYLGQVSASLRHRPPQISRAPAPGRPVGANSNASPTDVKSMNLDQYYAHITKRPGSAKR